MYLVASTELNRGYLPRFERSRMDGYTPAEVLAELGARVCYHSDAKFGEAPGFIKNLIDVKHLDVLEHGAAFVHFDCATYGAIHEQNGILPYVAARAREHGYFAVREEFSLNAPGLTLGANMRTWRDFINGYLSVDESYLWLEEKLFRLLAGVAPRMFMNEEPGISVAQYALDALPLKYMAHVYTPAVTYYGEVAQRVHFLGGCQWQWDGYATFLLEGVSRALTHQLVRHRLGSFSQSSQRYISLEKGKWSAVIPPAIDASEEARAVMDDCWDAIADAYGKLRALGIRKEDARFLLPNACESRIVVTMPFAGWEIFLDQRQAKDAQWEIRWVADAIAAVLQSYCPVVFAKEIPF